MEVLVCLEKVFGVGEKVRRVGWLCEEGFTVVGSSVRALRVSKGDCSR